MYKVRSTEYNVSSSRLAKNVTFAIVSDLHSRENTKIDGIVKMLSDRKPNYIFAVGDIFERLDGSLPERKQAGFELLRACAQIAPTFYSFGNHENGGTGSWNKLKWKKGFSISEYYDDAELRKIKECGAVLLDDQYKVVDGMAVGGLSSGLINADRAPDVSWLDELLSQNMPRILLCHHPEYYPKYLKDKDIDLVVAGHAHGGQWRIFGRGVFAPGQGLFPKYTSGVHHGNFVISRGLKPSGKIPRMFNAPEIVFVKTV